jgi:hypothetical protein
MGSGWTETIGTLKVTELQVTSLGAVGYTVFWLLEFAK